MFPFTNSWPRLPKPKPWRFCTVCDRPKLRRDLFVFLKDDGSLPHIREALGPALLSLPPLPISPSPAPELADFAINILEAEIQRPINPYPDWRRPFPTS